MAQSTTQLRYRDLLSKMVMLAIPTLLEQILSTLLQYVDTAMVGRLGEQATASVSVTTTIGWLVGSIAYALGTAVLALISRAYGANDTRRGSRLANQALLLTLVCGVVLGGISIVLSPFIPGWMGAEKAIRHQASSASPRPSWDLQSGRRRTRRPRCSSHSPPTCSISF